MEFPFSPVRNQGANIWPLCSGIYLRLWLRTKLSLNVHKLFRRLADYSLGTLAADTEFFDQGHVGLAVAVRNVLKQPFALTNELK